MSRDLGKLFVPLPSRDLAAIEWRRKLLASFNDPLLSSVAKVAKRQDDAHLRSLVKVPELRITPIEEAAMTYALFGAANPELPAETAVNLCVDTQIELHAVGMSDRLGRTALRQLKEAATFLVDEVLPKTRAKLAALELIAAFGEGIGVEQLLRYTPTYLASDVVVDLFRKLRSDVHTGGKDARRRARAKLDSLATALRIDGRELQDQKHSGWDVLWNYRNLTDAIKTLRSRNSGAADRLQTLAKAYDLTPLEQKLVLGHGKRRNAVSTAAIEVLLKRTPLPSERAFWELHTKYSRLLRQNPWIEKMPFRHVLDKADEYSIYIAEFDAFRVLEHVKIPRNQR